MPSRVVCFVCGSLGGEFGQLQCRPPPRKMDKFPFQEPIQGAYFPFLEHHDPPQGCRPPGADGTVDSCRVCHAFLTQQWDNYERSNTPAVKRLYWLKRLDDGQFTGAEMKLQGEYMAQVMGLQYQPASEGGGGGIFPKMPSPEPRERVKVSAGRGGISAPAKKRPIQEDVPGFTNSGGGVLDLSISVKPEPTMAKPMKTNLKDSGPKHIKDEDYGDSHFNREKLHPSHHAQQDPEPEAASFVCYTCGSDSGGLPDKFVSSRVHAPEEPHFPFLDRLAPHKGALPLTAQGVCRVCDLCFTSLCHQWLAYEQHRTPSSARIYRIKDLFFSNDVSLSMNGSNSLGQGREMVDDRAQKPSGDSVRKRHYSRDVDTAQSARDSPAHDDKKGIVEQEDSFREVCYLCSQIYPSRKMCPLYTTPAKSASRVEDEMYFPFIKELRRPQGARPLNPDGSVRVCVSCSGNLQAQWQQYQAENIPIHKQRYSLLPSSESPAHGYSSSPQSLVRQASPPTHSKLSVSQPLHLEIGRTEPGTSRHQDYIEAGPARPSSQTHVTDAPSAVPHASSPDIRQAIVPPSSTPAAPSTPSSTPNTIPHPLQQAGERPKKVCFLCGEKCLSTRSQILHTYPSQQEMKTHAGSVSFPFFPFIELREPAPNAEAMNADGTIVSCAYCYYSLLNQWRDYEEGTKDGSTADRWQRKYCLAEFACYVCGSVDVPRRSMRSLEVHKFGFLREHRAPPQALVMWGGECVGCCSWCHYSLSHQLAEYERLGLPPELHKYNWKKGAAREQPQPIHDENSCDTQDSVSDSLLPASSQAELNIHAPGQSEDSNHGPSLPSKPPAMPSLGSSHPGLGKLPPKTATVPPLNHHHHAAGLNHSSSSAAGANSATLRTSGFAAALRKLAHQAKDSTDEPGLKQTNSPPNSHSPRGADAAKLRASSGSSSQVNFPGWPLSSAPVVTIAPTQSQQSQHHLQQQLEARRSYERGLGPSSRSVASSSYEHHPSQQHRQHISHHHHQQQQQQQQQHHGSPVNKLESWEQQQSHSRQTPPSAPQHRDEDWSKDGRSSSRSSSRITPQASTSSPPRTSTTTSSSMFPLPSSQSLTTSVAALSELYARGLPGYRPDEEALRLSLAAGLPYGVDPTAYAAYAAAAAAAYHPALLQQQAVLAAQAAHNPYRLDDPLLLERYRLLQASSSPYFSFPGLAGLPPPPSVPGLGLHPALAAAVGTPPFPGAGAGHPAELLQRYPHPYLGPQGAAHFPGLDPLLDPRIAAAMLDRNRLEEEKGRELRELERSRESLRKEAEEGSRGREPGEREPSSKPHINATEASTSGSAKALYQQQREALAHLGHSISPYPDHKVNGSEPVYRESKGHHTESLKEPLRQPTPAHRAEAQVASSVRSKHSTQGSITSVIKPYDRAVDQRLSQNEVSPGGTKTGLNHHSSYHQDQQARGPPSLLPSPRLAEDGLKPSMLSPPPASYVNYSLPGSSVLPTVRKEKSTSDFFRPFDDVVKSDKDNEKVPEVVRGKAPGSTSPNHLSHPKLKPSRSNILSIPSVKVHPQYWSHGDISQCSQESLVPSTLPPSLRLPPSALAPSSLPVAAASVTGPATTSALLGGPPPLVPSTQPARGATDGLEIPRLSAPGSSITDRIERFDFKSLARECMPAVVEQKSSASPCPVSILDKRQAALRGRKRKILLSGEEECGDEEEEVQMTRLTLLTRVSPMPLDTGRPKMKLLENLGLTTRKRRRELELRKERRRRCKLRLNSLSPVLRDKDTTSAFNASSDPSFSDGDLEHHLSFEDGHVPEEKVHFVSNLGLRPLSHHQKKELFGKRMLMAHWRRLNSQRRCKKKHLVTKPGKDSTSVASSSSSSSSWSSSSLLVAPHLVKGQPTVAIAAAEQHQHEQLQRQQEQQNLVNAGLATTVRSVQDTHFSVGYKSRAHILDHRTEARPKPGHRRREESKSSREVRGASSSSEPAATNQQPGYSGIGQDLPVQHLARIGALHVNPALHPVRDPAAQAAGRVALPQLPGLQPSPHSMTLTDRSEVHRHGALAGGVAGAALPRPGESVPPPLALTHTAVPSYQLLQASPQDLEEAARRMNQHMAMWMSSRPEQSRKDLVESNKDKPAHKPL